MMMLRFISKKLLFLIPLFVLFLYQPKQVNAATCTLDRFNDLATYCSVSCGGNTPMDGYEGCGFGQYCCAATGKSCESNCAYGRKLYCSLNGGGFPAAPDEFQDCGFGRTCYIGSPDNSCPAAPPPAAPPYLCGIHNDPKTKTTTFCSEICGQGSVDADTSVSRSTCGSGGCCAVSPDRCDDCQYGRREVCQAADLSQGLATVPKSCPVGVCFLGAYDSSCPPPPNDGSVLCNSTPYEYNGRKLKTYCSGSCGGNLAVNIPGCGGRQCCVSNEDFVEPPDSFFNPSSGTDDNGNTPVFNMCAQAGANAGLCLQCADSQGVWTGVGCIPYNNTAETVRALMTIGLGLAGTVVVLMTLAGAFMLSTSKGDPQRVEEAKSLIVSAVSGILFLIFSVTILRFVGVTVLGLPGFG